MSASNLAPYGYAFFAQESTSTPKDEWVRNGMIFATETEAKQYGCDLMSRWFGICGGEVRPVDLHPTYKWVDGRAESLPQQICEAEDSVGPCRGSARTICPDCATSSDWATGSHICPSCGSSGPEALSAAPIPYTGAIFPFAGQSGLKDVRVTVEPVSLPPSRPTPTGPCLVTVGMLDGVEVRVTLEVL